MPRVGHYVGQTSQDGTISFDVSERGRHLTNLMLTITAKSPRGGRAVVDLPVAVDRIPRVGTAARWRGKVSGAGVTVTLEAQLNGSGITGDLCVDIDSGEGRHVSTGPLTWRARALPPY